MSFTAKLSEFNWQILGILLLISGMGIITLYSAAGGHIDPWAVRQFERFILGLILLFLCALTDVRFFRSYAYVFYVAAMGLLVFVDLKGHIGMGAQRWIDLYIFHLQPSELMKVALILSLAHYFHTHGEKEISQLRTYIMPMILIVVPALLVLRQPDLGTMVILASTGVLMIFVAGIRYWKIATFVGLISAALPFLWNRLHSYQKTRILTFLDPEQDPLNSGYHIIQSKIAIGSAGFWGKGFVSGTQSQLSFLPEKQTDFIFAMFVEEFGVCGGLVLLGLYAILIVYGFQVAFGSKNLFGKLLAIGISTLLFLSVFVNVGMVMGLLPVVGEPLPFMSYGGTSLLTMMMAMGMLMSVDINRSTRFGRSY